MTLSRRGLLRLAAGASLGAMAVPLVAIYARAAGSVAVHIRPPAAGTSGSRCVACGASDHTMLDAACPARPRLGAARSRIG